MEITKKKTVFENVTIGHKCDVCKKQHDGENYPNSWHYFNHSHESWGNDSIDSVEWFLVCSPECYFKQLKESLKEVGEYDEASIDNMGGDFVKELIKYKATPKA